VIDEKFGRPNTLQLWGALPVDFGKGSVAQGKPFGWQLREGRDLYMQHCVSCHDNSGSGNGFKAADLTPLPRDFRRGTFKWRSTT